MIVAADQVPINTQDKAKIYASKLKSWLSGYPTHNAAEKLAEKDIEETLKMIGKSEVEIPKRTIGDTEDHGKMVATIIMQELRTRAETVVLISSNEIEAHNLIFERVNLELHPVPTAHSDDLAYEQ